MKKWYRYLAAGVLVLLTLCVAGCGGVSHKSPEKVTEELIQSYTDGKEKKVKECYNQADNTEADLQTEITATLKYFAAHNPKKVSVQDCEILSENDKYSYVYITYNLILEDDQEYPCVETYMVGKQDKTYYIMAPSQITDDMKTQAATAYVQFMKTDAYKTYTKAYGTKKRFLNTISNILFIFLPSIYYTPAFSEILSSYPGFFLINVPYGWFKLCWYASHAERYSEEQRYQLLKYVDNRAVKGGNLVIDGHGMENIPKENGFIFFPNHQGLFDVLAIIQVCPVPFTALLSTYLRS